jgi:hypothetical protein
MTDRLDEESMKAVLEIVLDNMLKHNLVCSIEIGAAHALTTEMSVMLSARELWHQILLRQIISRVHADVVSRKLLPVTIHTLCSLLLDAVKSFDL